MTSYDPKLLFYICRIRFRNYPAYCFPLYMLIIYNRIRKMQQSFVLIPVPCELIGKIVEMYGLPFCDDVHNCVIADKNCAPHGDFVKIIKNRLAYLVNVNLNSRNVVLVSDLLLRHLGDERETSLKVVTFEDIVTATLVDLSVINTYNDLSNALIDTIVKNYFRTPKFVRKDDLISMDLQKYAPEFYYSNNISFKLKTVTFKCKKLLFDNQRTHCGFCVTGETEIKQSANVQGFLAPVCKNVCRFILSDYKNCLINRCPFGLQKYADDLEKAVAPFLKARKLQLKPIFLLQGSKGSGKTAIVSNLASKLGLHLYETISGDATASVYAQTETKIHNIFFRAKLCAPCVLLLNNFENFAKNNEGMHDERLIDFFKSELENLCINNTFPIILICISNSKEVHPELARVFLETFTIAAPDASERFQMLQWILASQNLEFQVNLEDIAEKLHGFGFEDLKALVFYARNNSQSALRDIDFQAASDLMQVSYKQSLGAPEIPKVQWSDVGGLTEVKSEIIRTIEFPLHHPQLLTTTGLRRSGILLYGPPGTGKTLIAKAVATECGLCFLSVKGPELLNMYVGQSEQNVREVFEKAREASPCIIFFDELDSLAPNRGISGDSGGVMDRVVSQLLAEMDGLNQSATIFIIGATNRPDLIDPALLRPGRFDKLLYVGPCLDIESKVGVLKALTRKFKLAVDADLAEIVRLCPKNVTGADFYGLCSNAWMVAVRKVISNNVNILMLQIIAEILDKAPDITHEDVFVSLEDFQIAMKELKPSVKPDDLVYFDKLQKQLNCTETRFRKK